MSNPTTQTPLTIPTSELAVLKPEEFAAIFGHHKTWAYRQIYAGKIKVITDMGRYMIPRAEVARLQNTAVIYQG